MRKHRESADGPGSPSNWAVILQAEGDGSFTYPEHLEQAELGESLSSVTGFNLSSQIPIF